MKIEDENNSFPDTRIFLSEAGLLLMVDVVKFIDIQDEIEPDNS